MPAFHGAVMASLVKNWPVIPRLALKGNAGRRRYSCRQFLIIDMIMFFSTMSNPDF